LIEAVRTCHSTKLCVVILAEISELGQNGGGIHNGWELNFT